MPKTAATISDRDGLARWYARRHFEIDAGVERIFYLPTNAPSREIRLLEVNRLISETASPAPIDFGVDVDGDNAHTLYVLDVTPSQWEAIQKNELELPKGWVLDDHSQDMGRQQSA